MNRSHAFQVSYFSQNSLSRVFVLRKLLFILQHLKTSPVTSDKETIFSATKFGQKRDSSIYDETLHKTASNLNGGEQPDRPEVTLHCIKINFVNCLLHLLYLKILLGIFDNCSRELKIFPWKGCSGWIHQNQFSSLLGCSQPQQSESYIHSTCFCSPRF